MADVSVVQRLTVGRAERFIEDLKSSLREAKERPSGASAGGNMVTVYGACEFRLALALEHRGMNLFLTGLGHSTAVGPRLVQKLATVFLDTLYKA